MAQNRLKLSFNQANELCREFIPVADGVFNYTAELEKAGFKAFLPRHQFIESFAETDEELQIHRKCIIECAKEELGQPNPILIYDEDLKKLYSSPFLQSLRDQRDRTNGCSVQELSRHYDIHESAWRREIDPCRKRLIQDRVIRRADHEVRFAAMVEAERLALQEESESCVTCLNKDRRNFDEERRYCLYTAVMERDAAALGFNYDQSRSRSRYPVFSMPIVDDWYLCWVIEEPRLFFFSPHDGRFEPSLELRNRRLLRRQPASGELLLIRYRSAVPGYFSGYSEFFNLDQLERAIGAHLYLYSLMAPIIERGIKKILGKPSLSS